MEIQFLLSVDQHVVSQSEESEDLSAEIEKLQTYVALAENMELTTSPMDAETLKQQEP